MMRFRQVKTACRHTSRRTYHREYTPPTYEELVGGSASRAARIQVTQVSPLAKNPRDHLANLFAVIEGRGMDVTDVFMSPSTMQILLDSGVFTEEWDGKELWTATVTVLDSMRRGEVILVKGDLRYGGTNQSTPADCPKIPSVRGSLLSWSTPRQPTSGAIQP